MDFKKKAMEILENPNYEKSGLLLVLEQALKEAYNEGIEESALLSEDWELQNEVSSRIRELKEK